MTRTVQDPPLDAQAERLQPIQDVPLWTESFHGSGYDPNNRLGVFVHVARAQFDPELWDETCVIYLPDGRFAVHRGFAYGDRPEGPAANAVTYVYRKPFEEWDLRFRGSVRVVTAKELAANTLADGVHVKAELDLTLRAIGPAFGIGGMRQEFWAHGHYEQHVGLRGMVTVDGTLFDFDGTGMRDHSVGPRDINDLELHSWCHGEFPSGRVFMAMDVTSAEGTCLRYAVVGNRDGLVEATVLSPGASLLASAAQSQDPYTLELEGPEGPTTIRAEILQSLPLSMCGTNDWVPGTRTDGHHLMYESKTRFEWDGEIGYGLTERSAPVR
ncbi:hypothetical protein [Nocardia neocaledoniensis]|uniref:hypothetical protein n=1 Tax=Nocardia neocaledoniensis TaxID=236511 RepID=UPI0024537903|nr:hypothetical protein [Nocardia neocaledoniensis]